MADQQNVGPPIEDGAPQGPAGSSGRPTTPTTGNHNRSNCRTAYDALAGNARRYAASRRLAPIPPCGCLRDPEHDQHRCDGEIDDHQARAAVAAVIHLDRLGTPALLDARTCRAMHRIGHHRLALDVHHRTTGAA